MKADKRYQGDKGAVLVAGIMLLAVRPRDEEEDEILFA